MAKDCGVTCRTFPDPARRKPPVDGFTLDELSKLLAACHAAAAPAALSHAARETWWQTLILVAYNTGLRIGSLMALEWEMLSDNSEWVRVPVKGGDTKSVFVNVHARAALNTMRALSEEGSKRIWYWPHNFEWLDEQRRRILQASGLPFERRLGFHAIRKAMCTEASRIDPLAASMQAGHSDMRMTMQHYINPSRAATAVSELPQPKWFRRRGAEHAQAKRRQKPPERPLRTDGTFGSLSQSDSYLLRRASGRPTKGYAMSRSQKGALVAPRSTQLVSADEMLEAFSSALIEKMLKVRTVPASDGPKTALPPKGSLSRQMTLSQFYEAYYKPVRLEARGAAVRNIEAIEQSLGYWKRFTGDPPIEAIDELTTLAFLNGLGKLQGRNPRGPSSFGNRGDGRMLRTLGKYPGGLSAEKLCKASGLRLGGSSFQFNLERLRREGFVSGDRDGIVLTQTGRIALAELGAEKTVPLSPNTIRKHCTHLQGILDRTGPRSREVRDGQGLLAEVPYLSRPRGATSQQSTALH